MTELATIYYGNDQADADLCDASKQFYKFVDTQPDLSTYTTTVKLESLQGDHQPL